MIRVLVISLAVLAAAAPAFAYPKLEARMLDATADAVLKAAFNNDYAGARAGCDAAKKLLTPKTPKYLAAYSEVCMALSSHAGGTDGQKHMCPYYLRAIDIWRTSPPPMDEEDAAIQRAGTLRQWKLFAARKCDAPAASARTDMGPITSIAPGSRLKTQDGLSYVVPEGWTISSFDETEGYALLANAGRQADLRIARVSMSNNVDYTDKSSLPGGRTLEWKYIEFIPKSGAYVMYGRAKLNGGAIEFGMTTSKDAPTSSIDKEFALATLRAVADTARIDGKRTCIGNCGPGTLIAPE